MSYEDHVIELLPAYALGAADADEVEQVEAHLPECLACQAELGAIQEITDDLPLAIAEVEPRAALQQQLMSRIEPSQTTPGPLLQISRWQQMTAVFRQHKTMAFSQLALLALAAVLLVSNILLWQQVNELESDPEPDRMQAIQLTSTGIIPNADGFLTISADGLSGAIILDQVPQLEEEQQYQLWLVKDGERTSAALLSVDELGYGGNRVRAPQSLFNYAWAEITIEQAEGSSQPTSDVILKTALFP
jgi:anti-sigma factor RsiW